MKILTLSGKGGAGKSMIASSLAVSLAEKGRDIIAVDADVDAPDMAVWLNVDDYKIIKPLYAAKRVKVKQTNAPKLLDAIKECPHKALQWKDGKIIYKQYLCEGCGLCSVLNPEYFEMVSVENGEIREYETSFGFTLVEGKLFPGFTGSGKVVEEVISYAESKSKEIMVIDGAAGTGCPVNAALRQVDFVIFVVEESLSGVRDFERVLAVVEHFQKPFSIVINKHGLNEDIAKEIEAKFPSKVIGKIPYTKAIAKCATKREVALKCYGREIKDVIEKVEKLIELFSKSYKYF